MITLARTLKRKAERMEREREDREKAISDFRAGVDFNHYLAKQMPCMLRVNGDQIETSHGASFPVKDGEKVFRFIRYVRDRAEAWQRNNTLVPSKGDTREAYRLGSFKVDRIDSRGNIIVGCHSVKWDQIEHVARQLNIYP